MSITISDVTGAVSTSLPDSVIQSMINSVESRVGVCLDSAYDEDTANLIRIYLVGYMAEESEGKTTVKSKTSANGASVSYSERNTSNLTAFQSSHFGNLVEMLDSSGCYRGMFVRSVGIATIGKKNRGYR